MSYDPCKYCGQMAFKTDGNADLICYKRANTGDCSNVNYDDLKVFKELHDSPSSNKPRTRPSVDIRKEYELIQQKKSNLSRSDREWVIEQFNKL